MGVIVSIIVVFILGVIGVLMYKMGKEDGRHKERMHLIDILTSMLSLEADISVDRRYGIMHVTNYIVNRLREE